MKRGIGICGDGFGGPEMFHVEVADDAVLYGIEYLHRQKLVAWVLVCCAEPDRGYVKTTGQMRSYQIYLGRLNVALLELLGALFETLEGFDLCGI